MQGCWWWCLEKGQMLIRSKLFVQTLLWYEIEWTYGSGWPSWSPPLYLREYTLPFSNSNHRLILIHHATHMIQWEIALSPQRVLLGIIGPSLDHVVLVPWLSCAANWTITVNNTDSGDGCHKAFQYPFKWFYSVSPHHNIINSFKSAVQASGFCRVGANQTMHVHTMLAHWICVVFKLRCNFASDIMVNAYTWIKWLNDY